MYVWRIHIERIMPSETIHNKARSASNFKTRKNSKAPSLREKSNPDVWDPKATNVKCSVEWVLLSATKWALCWQGQRVTHLSYGSENKLSAHHLDTVDKIIVPSSVRQKVPGVCGSSNMGHDTFLLKLSLTVPTLVADTLKVAMTFYDPDCFFHTVLAAWGIHITSVINH